MFPNKEIHRHLPCNTAASCAGDHKNGAPPRFNQIFNLEGNGEYFKILSSGYFR